MNESPVKSGDKLWHATEILYRGSTGYGILIRDSKPYLFKNMTWQPSSRGSHKIVAGYDYWFNKHVFSGKSNRRYLDKKENIQGLTRIDEYENFWIGLHDARAWRRKRQREAKGDYRFKTIYNWELAFAKFEYDIIKQLIKK
jgi:hypothetical protein